MPLRNPVLKPAVFAEIVTAEQIQFFKPGIHIDRRIVFVAGANVELNITVESVGLLFFQDDIDNTRPAVGIELGGGVRNHFNPLDVAGRNLVQHRLPVQPRQARRFAIDQHNYIAAAAQTQGTIHIDRYRRNILQNIDGRTALRNGQLIDVDYFSVERIFVGWFFPLHHYFGQLAGRLFKGDGTQVEGGFALGDGDAGQGFWLEPDALNQGVIPAGCQIGYGKNTLSHRLGHPLPSWNL